MKEHSTERKGTRITSKVMLAVSLMLCSTHAGILPAPEQNGPSGNVSFPDFKQFDLTEHVGSVDFPASGTPQIAEWTRSNGPGDTLALSGNELSSYGSDAEGRDTRFVVFGQFGSQQVFTDARIQRLDGMVAAITLPDAPTFPSETMYLLWPKNSLTYGRPVAINQTEAWWIGPRKTSKGHTFSVYGRNLSLEDGRCHLYVEELDRWLTSTSENPYKADFVVPSDMDNDTYTVWAHNGHGREYGWGKPLSLTVQTEVDWNGGKTINVKTDHGATGNGSSDDYSSIASAFSDAEAGDTVYFPAGIYAISDNIVSMSSNIRILGAGSEASIITTHPNYSGSEDAGMIHKKLTGVEIRDMGFEAGSYNPGKILRCRGSVDTKIINCRFSQLGATKGGNVVDLSGGSQRIVFDGCDFIVRLLAFVGNADGALIKDCNFYGLNDTGQLLNISGADNISIIGCTGQHYDDSDWTSNKHWCQGRFIHGSGNAGTSMNVYIGDNSTTNLYPRYNFDIGRWDGQQKNLNTGEQIMFEHQRTRYRGAVISGTPTTVKCSGLSSGLDGLTLAVVDGRGFGQSRYVGDIDTSSGTVTVTEPWQVVPDSSSTIMIGRYIYRTVVYGNRLDGATQCYERGSYAYEPETYINTASCGVSFYGSHLQCVVANNTMTELESGILNWSIPQDIDGVGERVVMPNYFNVYVDNKTDGVMYGMGDRVYGATVGNFTPDVAVLGTVWRNNTFSDVTEMVVTSAADNPLARIEGCVFDNNHATDFADSNERQDGLYNQVWIGNTFEGDGSGSGITLASSHIPVLRENTWKDFSSKYGGSLPGAILEIPVRVVEVASNSVVKIDVLNSGTDTLRWTATTDDAWVSITKSSGIISDEHGSDTLTMAVDVEAIPAGDTEAVIKVVNEDTEQEQQMTIVMASDSILPPPPEPPPAPVLSAIEISGPANVNEGTTAQYVCTASYSDGTTEIVSATWSESSSSTSINSSGVLTAGDVSVDKSVTVTASFDGMTDTHAVTLKYVEAVLTGITISGPTQINEEATGQYSCTANYSDGTSTAVIPSWSENSASASINSSGLLTAGNVSSDKSVTVTASFGGQSDTHSVTIKYVAPVLTGLVITGPSQLNEGTTAQYTCTASYSDGTSAVVAPSWSESSYTTTISASGILTASNVSSDKNMTVTASFGGLTDTHAVTVKHVEPVLTGIAISGLSQVDEETAAQYTCTASYSDGTSAAVSPSWSENSSYASISASGLLSAGNVDSDKSLTVTASFGGQSDTHPVTINFVAPPVLLTGLTISGPGSIEENSTGQYICAAYYSDGSSEQVTPVWGENSSETSINGAGLLSAGNVGTDSSVTVSASYDGESAAKAVVVMAVGDQVVLPLSGFAGKTISAELWDQSAEQWIELGEEYGPQELVVENVTPNQWYWLGLSEYDEGAGEWVLVHGRWIMR